MPTVSRLARSRPLCTPGGTYLDPDLLLLRIGDGQEAARTRWGFLVSTHESVHWRQLHGTTVGAFRAWIKHSQEVEVLRHLRELPPAVRSRLLRARARGEPIVAVDDEAELPVRPIPGATLREPGNLLRAIWMDHAFARTFLLSSSGVVRSPAPMEDMLASAAADASSSLRRYHPELGTRSYEDSFRAHRLPDGAVQRVVIEGQELDTHALLDAGAIADEAFLQGWVRIEQLPGADGPIDMALLHLDFDGRRFSSTATHLLKSAYGAPLRTFFRLAGLAPERLESWVTAATAIDFALNPPLPPVAPPAPRLPEWRILYPPIRFLEAAAVARRLGAIELPADHGRLTSYLDRLAELTQTPPVTGFHTRPPAGPGALDFAAVVKEHCEEKRLYGEVPPTYYDFVRWCQARLWIRRGNDLLRLVAPSLACGQEGKLTEHAALMGGDALEDLPPLSCAQDGELVHSHPSSVALGSWLLHSAATFGALQEVMTSTGDLALPGLPPSLATALREAVRRDVEKALECSPWPDPAEEPAAGADPGDDPWISRPRRRRAGLLRRLFGWAEPRAAPPPAAPPRAGPPRHPALEIYVDRLVEVSRRFASPSGAGFLGPGKEPTVSIGAEIAERWGMPGMLYVVERIQAENLGPGAARELEYVWDGVGDWRG